MNIKEHTTQSDEQLLQQYRSTRDNQWLGYLLQRYTLLLLGVGMKYLKDKEASQDAVQQVFLKAIMHLPEGNIYNFKGWLYVLMRNHCLQILRDATNIVPVEQVQIADEPQSLAHQNYTAEQINDALKELAPDQKNTIVLFYLKKLSYQQIMEQTGYTFMQVKSYIQNGKRNLKSILLKKTNGHHD